MFYWLFEIKSFVWDDKPEYLFKESHLVPSYLPIERWHSILKVLIQYFTYGAFNSRQKVTFTLSCSYFFKPLKMGLPNFWIVRFCNGLEFDVKDNYISIKSKKYY